MSTLGNAAKPKIGNVTRYFLPGLVIGLTVGTLGGAFYAPRLEQGLTPPSGLNRQVDRTRTAPEERPAPGPTGQSGITGEAPATPQSISPPTGEPAGTPK
jgi:hypothetical protein